MDTKIKILIIEDEALIAENLRLTLEDLGYEVLDTCYTFSQALTQIVSNKADLILLDINLGGSKPEENGIALGYTIASTCKKPFIFLTAYSDRDTIERATQLAPSGYLVKPVNPAGLFAAIQTAIAQEHAGNSKAAAGHQPEYFFVKIGDRNHRLLWEDVYCIESGKNYVRLRIRNGIGEYPIRGSLAFVLEQLVPAHLQGRFVRVNRSICLNKNFVTACSAEEVFCGKESFENTRYSAKELQEVIAGAGLS